MRSALYLLVAVILTSLSLAQSQGPARNLFTPGNFKFSKSDKPFKYSKEALVIERIETRVSYNADGTGTREKIARIRLQSEAGVQSLAVLTFPYDQANEKIDISYVRVRKPNGTVVVTRPQDVQDMASAVTRVAPMYSDIHEKHVPVKSLGVGDVLEFAIRYRITKPEIPGQFWFQYSFTNDAIVFDEELQIEIPANKYVKVGSPELNPVMTANGTRRTYTWKTKNLQRADTDTQNLDLQPSVQLTTFSSWSEVAHWYQALQEQQVTVTPEIQAKAYELTSRRIAANEKIRALYNFVSTQIHYISLSFGIGRYQPHTAAEVFANGYGDCKDKHTLLAALLKAAGLRSWPALINSSRKISPDIPSPGQFNHVITAVPDGNEMVWLDTTAEVAPFRLLAPSLRDKQALVIPSDGTAASLVKTPSNSPIPSWYNVTINGRVGTNGSLAAHVQHSASGDLELPFRLAFREYPQADWDNLVQQHAWSGGTVRGVTATSPDELDMPFEFAYDYVKNNYASGDGHVPIPFPAFDIESSINEDKKPTEPVYLGPAGEVLYKATIALPTGYPSSALPKRLDYVTDFADYHARYSLNGGVLTANRELRIKKSELPISEWGQALKFRRVLIRDRAGNDNQESTNALLFILVGVLFISGLVIVVFVWKRSGYSLLATPSTGVLPDPRLTGIGGWLALLIIRLWLSVVINLVDVSKNHDRFWVGVGLGFAVLAAIAAIFMTVKNYFGVKLANLYLLLEASAYLFLIWKAALLNNVPLFERTSAYFVAAIVWWIYLVRSKRVKYTYFVADWEEPLRMSQSASSGPNDGPPSQLSLR